MNSPLKNALALSQQMLAAAEAGEWELLCRLESEEKNLLSGLVIAESPPQEFTRSILDNHKKILDLAVPARDDMKILLDTFSKHTDHKKTE